MNTYLTLVHTVIYSQIFKFGFSGVILNNITPVKVARNLDKSFKINFDAFGTKLRTRLTPSSIFASDFKSWSTDHKLRRALMPQKEVSQHGSFYSDGSYGSVHIIHESDSAVVDGIIDNLHIQPYTPDRNLHRVKRQPTSHPSAHPTNSSTNKSLKSNVNKSTTKVSRSTDDSSDAVIKILVVLDYNNCKNLDFDQNKIQKYLGVFWNDVNQRFSELSDPTVTLSISGLITMNSKESQPFITNNAEGDNTVDENVLKDFQTWLTQQDSLPEHDVAMLQTTSNGGKIVDGKSTDSVTGLAYIGTACQNDGSNSGFFEDRAPTFNGVLTAAHELAHLLNAPHDGEDTASDCPASDGYIMGHSKFDSNSWHFSSCTLDIIKEFLQSNQDCFSDSGNSDEQNIPLDSEYPAELVGSLDQQCRDRSQNESYQFWGSVSEDICTALWCSLKGSSDATSLGGAVEGTPCNIQKICLNGECAPNGIPSLDDQCKAAYGDDSTALQTNNPDVCSNLQCSNGDEETTLGPAAEGSSCGNAGVCKSESCDGQVPSFDEQCATNFGDDHKAVQKDADEMCSELWCSADGTHFVSRGAANENTNCGDGQACQNGSCAAL